MMRALFDLYVWFLITLRIIPRPNFLTVMLPEHPNLDTIKGGKVYVVERDGYRKWAYFRCPADRDEIIQLSLMPERRPRWKIEIDKLGRPTISPSVRQT